MTVLGLLGCIMAVGVLALGIMLFILCYVVFSAGDEIKYESPTNKPTE